MIKSILTVVSLLSLLLVHTSFAQAEDGGVKVYSGCLHQFKAKSEASFWSKLMGGTPSKQEEEVPDKQCAIEFRSPIAFSNQSVSVLPEKLSYVISFQDKPQTFEKFTIEIYAKDEEEYTIDPDAEGKQVGINDEHHIFDDYLIYLIMGTGIDHLEVISSSGKDRYVLDKLEVRNDH